MDILNLSTSTLVISVYFDNIPSSSTLTRLYGFCSLFNVVMTNQMIWTGACFDAVGNTHRIIELAQKIVSTEVNPRMEVVL